MNKKIAIAVAILIIVLAIGVGVWRWKEKNNEKNISEQQTNKNGQNNNEVDTSDWKTYRNEKLGVIFDYPSKWGKIVEFAEQGCPDYEKGGVDADILNEKDDCKRITLSGLNTGEFFSTGTPLLAKYGFARGGYWGDAAITIESENFIANFCKEKKNICEVFKTKNNILIAKNVEQREYAESSDQKIIVYYIKSTHPIYFGIAMSSDRLNYNNAEEDLINVIESLKFLQ